MDYFAITSISVLLVGVLVGALFNIRRQNISIAQLLQTNSDQLQVSEEELRLLSFYDPLTGLPNRRRILDSLDEEVNVADRYGRCGALFYIDIDNFKNINDTLGHEHGDKLLTALGRRLKENIRRADTVARLGGDEFLILMRSEPASEDVAIQKADSLARKLLSFSEQPYIIDEHKHFVSISIGITLFRGQLDTPLELLRQADTALFKAKGKGKNTVCFFHRDMQELVEKKLAMERELRDALETDQLSLVYQPQVDANGTVQSAEALLRWTKPDGTKVSPAEFIPVAEDTGLIFAIGNWVLETACRQMKVWTNTGLPLQYVSVNVSPRQFNHEDFVAQVRRTLSKCGLPASCLMIELTESVVVDNFAATRVKMEQLISLGVNISMDDFGTGYSSLSYLTELPFHELKIDQSFVRNLFNGEKNSAVAKAIIALANSLDMSVLAEGVEEQAQLDFLSEHDCSRYQGYLFSRPLPSGELEALLEHAVRSKRSIAAQG